MCSIHAHCLLAVYCGYLTNPSNGMVTFTTTTFGSTANYVCNTGYTLSGGSTRTCQSDGTWSGSPPTCAGEHLNNSKHCVDTLTCNNVHDSCWLWTSNLSHKWNGHIHHHNLSEYCYLQLWHWLHSQWREHQDLSEWWDLEWVTSDLCRWALEQ